MEYSLTRYSLALLALLPFSTEVAGLFFNSIPNNDAVAIATTRDAWFDAIGISDPQFLVDFESPTVAGLNVHDIPGLFPAGLVIRDADAGSATVSSGPVFGGSNPVDNFAVAQNERPFLELDFSLSPVDYVGVLDIDHSGTTVVVTFLGGTTQNFLLDTTGASQDSAEFAGFYRNDQPRITLVQFDASGDGQWGIDNIEYGIIPEPSRVVLLMIALGGIAARRRRGPAVAD